jgi:probable addiction module antidote protein
MQEEKNMAKSKKHQEWLIEKLKDHDEAVAYLNAALEESLKGDEESQHLFLIALKNVAEAQGGVGELAKKAQIGRESLYKTLSETGNPKWHTLVSLVNALGLNLRFA